MQGFKVERTLGNLGFVTAILAFNTYFNFKSGRFSFTSQLRSECRS